VYVIYLDILFFINWMMNTFIFCCVSLMLNKHIKYTVTFLAGAIASLVYCMLPVMPLLQKIPYAIYALVIPIPSILILYKPNHYKLFFKEYILCMVSAALFGGVVFSSWYLINGASSEPSSVSILLLLGIGIVVVVCFYSGFYLLRRQFIFPAFEYTLTIHYKGKDICLQSLLDTGNLLYTPYKHEPVLVVEYDGIKSLLTNVEQETYEYFKKSNDKEIEEGIINGVYALEQLIPFNSVGCKNGFLWRVQVDQIEIQKYNKKIRVTPCIVGISSERLFSDRQFQALLHPEFILEEARVS